MRHGVSIVNFFGMGWQVAERSDVVIELLVKELAETQARAVSPVERPGPRGPRQAPFQRARAAAVLARVAPREDEAVVKA